MLMCLGIHTHTRAHIHMRMCAHTHTGAHIHTHACMHTHTHTHTHKHTHNFANQGKDSELNTVPLYSVQHSMRKRINKPIRAGYIPIEGKLHGPLTKLINLHLWLNSLPFVAALYFLLVSSDNLDLHNCVHKTTRAEIKVLTARVFIQA